MAKPPSRKSRGLARGSVAEEVATILPPGFPGVPTTPRIIVTVHGKKGIFIPLEAADLIREQPIKELAKTIQSLQSVLAEKELEITGLKKRISELVAPPQSPDDFSAALQSTVDSLQTELSRLSNPIANFAVKEFKIETRAGVRITPLGTAEYRFAGPGERISPESQSQLSLTLVPVEKKQDDRNLDRFLAPLRPISQISELAAKEVSKDFSAQKYFETNHVYTISEFLRIGSRANIQARIAAAIKVDSNTLVRWLEIAELLLIKDIDYALVIQMQKAGISGMRGLQKADADKAVALLKRADIDSKKFRRWQAIAARYLEAR